MDIRQHGRSYKTVFIPHSQGGQAATKPAKGVEWLFILLKALTEELFLVVTKILCSDCTQINC